MKISLIDELCLSMSDLVLEPNSSEEYKQLRKEENECYEELNNVIDEKGKILLIALADAHECLEVELTLANFRKGFKCGIGLLMEALFGNKDISDLDKNISDLIK